MLPVYKSDLSEKVIKLISSLISNFSRMLGNMIFTKRGTESSIEPDTSKITMNLISLV